MIDDPNSAEFERISYRYKAAVAKSKPLLKETYNDRNPNRFSESRKQPSNSRRRELISIVVGRTSKEDRITDGSRNAKNASCVLEQPCVNNPSPWMMLSRSLSSELNESGIDWWLLCQKFSFSVVRFVYNWLDGSRRSAEYRQSHGHYRAFAAFTLHTDCAAVQIHAAPYDHQP